MSVLDNALVHFERNRSTLLDIEVPEWGGKVYFYAVSTMREKSTIRAAIQEDEVRGMMVLLIERALTEDKTPIFNADDIDQYMESLDPDVIARVAAAIENESTKHRKEMLAESRD